MIAEISRVGVMDAVLIPLLSAPRPQRCKDFNLCVCALSTTGMRRASLSSVRLWRVIPAAILWCAPYLGAADAATDGAWGSIQKAMAGDVDQRKQALAAIGAIDAENAKAVKMAEDALQDKNPTVRQMAAWALGEMKAKQAIPSLREALSDKGEVAFAAARALSEMGDSGGRDMFVAVIAGERSDAPGIVEKGIRDAKQRLKHPEGILLMGAEDATGAMFGPAGYGISAAKEAFKEKGSSDRATAAYYLAKDPDP